MRAPRTRMPTRTRLFCWTCRRSWARPWSTSTKISSMTSKKTTEWEEPPGVKQFTLFYSTLYRIYSYAYANNHLTHTSPAAISRWIALGGPRPPCATPTPTPSTRSACSPSTPFAAGTSRSKYYYHTMTFALTFMLTFTLFKFPNYYHLI